MPVQLFAYNPIGQPDELLVWVGILGITNPPDISFHIGGDAIKPLPSSIAFEPMGDSVCDALGHSLNHRAIYALPWPATDVRFQIHVTAGSETVSLSSRRPPVNLPAKGNDSFNVLLSSCYYQPNDKSLPLASLINNIKPEPDFTLLAGDQVYLDLPSSQNLPKNKNELARVLGKKYQANWFSTSRQQPGLADVLRHGPVFCVPDDHEYWNNFPLYQVQLDNTHWEKDRNNWRDLAMRLFESYQMSPAQRDGFFRKDIAPLSMLFLDGRSHRDEKGAQMFNDATHIAIEQWAQDLIACKNNNLPAVGLLSSGQALLIEKPGRWSRKLADMEMPNYNDFSVLTSALATLFARGIPVLYITGDVHWGRIVEGKSPRGNTVFYEVIASPSRLIDTVGTDQINLVKDAWRNLKGNGKDFPLHSEAPPDTADIKLANLNLTTLHRQQGDHVAMLRFHAIPGGLEFSVDYICTDADEKKRREHSSTHGPYKLLSL